MDREVEADRKLDGWTRCKLTQVNRMEYWRQSNQEMAKKGIGSTMFVQQKTRLNVKVKNTIKSCILGYTVASLSHSEECIKYSFQHSVSASNQHFFRWD